MTRSRRSWSHEHSRGLDRGQAVSIWWATIRAEAHRSGSVRTGNEDEATAQECAQAEMTRRGEGNV